MNSSESGYCLLFEISKSYCDCIQQEVSSAVTPWKLPSAPPGLQPASVPGQIFSWVLTRPGLTAHCLLLALIQSSRWRSSGEPRTADTHWRIIDVKASSQAAGSLVLPPPPWSQCTENTSTQEGWSESELLPRLLLHTALSCLRSHLILQNQI